jgi:ABC-type branched-subunit amino acid transport system ATPase component
MTPLSTTQGDGTMTDAITDARATTRPGEIILAIDELRVSYGGAVRALDGLTMSVRAGEVVSLLGVNGAGKTTTLRAIMGLLPYNGGARDGGSISFEGSTLDGIEPTRRVRRGVSMVMEGRRVFADLSIEENLRAASYSRAASEWALSRDAVYALFPILGERSSQLAGLLSGGEQQMLAIARALMQKPRLLLLDEPSLGLAPLIVEQIKQIVLQINGEGTSILLIEQNAAMGLSACDYAYVLEGKRVAREGSGAQLLADKSIRDLYLGISDEGRRSYRQNKRAGRMEGTSA